MTLASDMIDTCRPNRPRVRPSSMMIPSCSSTGSTCSGTCFSLQQPLCRMQLSAAAPCISTWLRGVAEDLPCEEARKYSAYDFITEEALCRHRGRPAPCGSIHAMDCSTAVIREITALPCSAHHSNHDEGIRFELDHRKVSPRVAGLI